MNEAQGYDGRRAAALAPLYAVRYQIVRRYSVGPDGAVDVPAAVNAVALARDRGVLAPAYKVSPCSSESTALAIISTPHHAVQLWHATEDLLLCSDGLLRLVPTGAAVPAYVRARQHTGPPSVKVMTTWIDHCRAVGMVPGRTAIRRSTARDDTAIAILHDEENGMMLLSRLDWLVLVPLGLASHRCALQVMADAQFRTLVSTLDPHATWARNRSVNSLPSS